MEFKFGLPRFLLANLVDGFMPLFLPLFPKSTQRTKARRFKDEWEKTSFHKRCKYVVVTFNYIHIFGPIARPGNLCGMEGVNQWAGGESGRGITANCAKNEQNAEHMPITGRQGGGGVEVPKWGLRNCRRRGEEGRFLLSSFPHTTLSQPGPSPLISLKCANAETTFTCYTQRKCVRGPGVLTQASLGKFHPASLFAPVSHCSCAFFAHFIIFYDCASIIFWHGGGGSGSGSGKGKVKRNGTTSFAISGPVPQQEGRNQEPKEIKKKQKKRMEKLSKQAKWQPGSGFLFG